MAENTNTEREASDASAILSKICDLFQIGKLARTESTILVNVENVIHHARLLHAVERDLFPQPELPEDDDQYATVDDELPAPNSWAANDEADYVAQFRAALAARASLSLPAAGQEPMAHQYLGGDGEWHNFIDARHYKITVESGLWQIRPLYADPQPAVAAGWMPIETAPKDGTVVLLAGNKGKTADGSWAVKPGLWIWPYVLSDPTHWMPLPPAPSTEGESNG